MPPRLPSLFAPTVPPRYRRRPVRLLAPWLGFLPALCLAQVDGVAPVAEPGAPSAAASAAGPETAASATAPDRVRMRSGAVQLEADRVQVDLAKSRVRAEGAVKLQREDDYFIGKLLEIGTEDYTGFVLEPQYRIARTQSGGQAARLDFLGRNQMYAAQATYSSCTVDDGQTLPWVLSARGLRLDIDRNEGIAENAVLRFYGVPILAAPRLSFPVTDERKSGWLPAQISGASNNGFEIAAPYYWNIAPNVDATFTPTSSSRRGPGLETELRYLQPAHRGELRWYDMPNDQLAGRERWAVRARQDASWRGNLFFDASLLRVSDDAYWKDGLRNSESLIPRLLPTQALLQQRDVLNFGGGADIEQALYGRVQRWQALHSTDPSADFIEPYRRAPQVGARWRSVGSALDWWLETEANRFTHSDPTRLTGDRAHVIGSVGWAHGDGGWRLTPRLSFNAATYTLDRPMANGRRDAARLIPTVSVDSTWTFERSTALFDRGLTQTLEPRLVYLRTPWRDQTALPNFDSAPLDFNAISVFADNTFSGVDRVADAHQLTAGVSTRFIGASDGAELLRLGMAQRYLFSDQRITPDGKVVPKGVSDLLLFGSTTAIDRWNLDSALQYNTDSGRVARTITNVRYSPGPYRTVNASYRLQRGVSEQFGVGWQWPLWGPAADAANPAVAGAAAFNERRATRAGSACQGTLYGVGRVDYSMRDQRWSNSLVGLEYDAGCWIGRFVVERQSTTLRTATTKWWLQLELIGLSRLGSNPLARLRDNIPGYQLLYDRKANGDIAAGAR